VGYGLWGMSLVHRGLGMGCTAFGFRVPGVGFWVDSSGSRIEGLSFGVWGLRCKA
jgi:hypothetical protein